MAEVLGILGAIYTSANILGDLAASTSKWRHLSDRLFDIQEGLDAAELTLKAWQQKYDVQDRRHEIYVHILFGRLGWERIQQTLGSIKIVSKTISSDIDKVLSRALLANPHRKGSQERDGYDKELVQECLRRIKSKTSWSRKFQYSVLGKADDLEMRLIRLHRKLSMLERFSDHYLELEHPDVFQTIKRLPGRKIMLKVGDARAADSALDALSARKDAELLHRASGQNNRVHIGLSVPQIHKRDFAFLLSLNGQTHEVLVHPVKIKAINDRTRLSSEISTAVPTLLRNTNDPCYMLPSSSRSEGFQISLPPQTLLSDLEHRDPLATQIRLASTPTFLGEQVLYPQDQIAISTGIAHGAFRLIGSQWLTFLDSANVRWRRSAAEGHWTVMLAAHAVPSNAATARTLDTALAAARSRRDNRDLTKHAQIFRIGLLLAELALKTPISYIDYDSQTSCVRIYISSLNSGDGVPVDACEIAAEVENRTNVLLGNMVFFCLSALQDRDMMGDREVEARYYREVCRDARELEGIVRAEGRRGKRSPMGSGAATPRSSRSGGAGVY